MTDWRDQGKRDEPAIFSLTIERPAHRRCRRIRSTRRSRHPINWRGGRHSWQSVTPDATAKSGTALCRGSARCVKACVRLRTTGRHIAPPATPERRRGRADNRTTINARSTLDCWTGRQGCRGGCHPARPRRINSTAIAPRTPIKNPDGSRGDRRSNDGDGRGSNRSDDGSDDDDSRTKLRLEPRYRLRLRR